jgi:hypothetical protein
MASSAIFHQVVAVVVVVVVVVDVVVVVVVVVVDVVVVVVVATGPMGVPRFCALFPCSPVILFTTPWCVVDCC